ncbi:hypothetical protein KIV56_17705 [Cryobacterium breve]|uniref:Uncharacterized protein n=1 Tax=Cryobacterium breve TaxID=1259258 RepID=A0ABY7NBS8_9MICO|nr:MULTISPECIES: hypothetical protein [Cryobacterium]MDY7543416.1 hypothetical protein [Cryobacterium sp. 5B3]MEB0000638.1 hypothetical protein [Cryobacterium sp. RTS3]MEB0264939.1 hypothetical protein [Cryobacterium sp. 10I5]MEB0274738.1 hypothetical protein [Cryobacterium sp. 5B3]WBM79965.1 hypothetical protein KIV56_17705 [Cryobacterium breve]
MSFEFVFVWIILGAIALLDIGLLLYAQTERSRDRVFLQFWQKAGLPVQSDDIARAIRTRLRARSTAALVGALVGLLGSAAVLVLQPSLASSTFIWLVVLPATLIGFSAVDVAVALRESLFRPPVDAPRLARPTIVTLSDYVSPWRLRAAPLLVLLAFLLTIAGILLGLAGTVDLGAFLGSPALPVLALASAVLIAGIAASRKVLMHTQPATTELELAWDDAFRGETLRSLLLFETIIAWLAVGAVSLGILNGWDALRGTTWSIGLGPQIFNWGYLAILLWFGIGSATGRFRRRLWPDLTASPADPAAAG